MTFTCSKRVVWMFERKQSFHFNLILEFWNKSLIFWFLLPNFNFLCLFILLHFVQRIFRKYYCTMSSSDSSESQFCSNPLKKVLNLSLKTIRIRVSTDWKPSFGTKLRLTEKLLHPKWFPFKSMGKIIFWMGKRNITSSAWNFDSS